MINGIIGVRFARNCYPDDLWTSYFTSSVHVAVQRWLYGEPDVIEVRRTFDDSIQAREWEHKVLRRLKVIGDDKWLNKGTGKAIPPMSGKAHPFYGIKFSEEHKKNMRKPKSSTINMKHTEEQIKNMKKPKTENTKKKMSESFTKERRAIISQNISSLIWITDGNRTKRVNIGSQLPDGWRKGRPSEYCGKGKKRTSEQIKKIKEARKTQIMKKGWFWITNRNQKS